MEKKYHIGFEIRIMSNLLKRQFGEFVSPKVEEHFTESQRQLVDFLYNNRDNSEIFQRDVEEKFSIRRSTASRLIQSMEKRGVLAREPVAKDARLKRVFLTEMAINNHEMIRARIDEFEARISNGLTDDEIKSFFDISEKIKRNLS